ncbi:MAG: hypothetical protein ACXACW_14960, partial [Candidatus Hodarchaeales archaeon]
MFVNRRKIRIGSVTGESIDFNIPIKLNADPLDNEDLVKTTFVDEEVEKAINEITDFKKVRFKPATVKNGRWTIVPEIKIELKFFKSDGTYSNEYASLGFTSEDIFCRVNRLMKSFLSLDYYDSTNSAENIFLTNSDVYTQIGDDQTNEIGIPFKANVNPISYRLGDPTLRPNEVHEGFHIFWFSNDVLNAENYEYTIYLSPTYQNAGDGSVSVMTPVTGSFDSRDLNVFGLGGDNGTQYIRVILKYEPSTGNYMYTVRHNNERQLLENGGGIDWNNDEPNHIPTLTLYQLQPSNVTNFSNTPPSSTTSTENTDDSGSRGSRVDENPANNISFIEEPTNTVQKPTLGVTTENTTGSNVLINGSVTDDGGATITERGFVYSTNQSPTITSGNKISIAGGVGSMSTTLNDLAEGTYYARAFATNSEGTTYSNQIIIDIVVVDVGNTTDDTTNDDTIQFNVGSAGDFNIGNQSAQQEISLDMFYRNTGGFVSIENGGTINHRNFNALEIKAIVVNNNGEEQVSEKWELISTTGLLNSERGVPIGSSGTLGVPNTVGTHTLTFAPSNYIINEVTIT